MLCAIVGGIGNGKTLFLTYLALIHYLNGYRILSDYLLNFPHKNIECLEDVEKELQKDGIDIFTFMAFDEGWIFLDSRLSGSKKNIIWSRFMMQTRKVGFDVYITLQHIGQIDLRVRNVTDRIFFPNITKWEGKPRKSKPLKMEVKCIRRNVLGNLELYHILKYNIKNELLELYDTREIIKSLDYLEGKY